MARSHVEILLHLCQQIIPSILLILSNRLRETAHAFHTAEISAVDTTLP